MSESPRSVQAAALEIPVTIQGSKSAESADQRELFSETTATTLVFENGAVVSLKSRLNPGQCVFLRNDRTGKEILCKVLEWREQGECRYADLEFTAYEPQFWGLLSEDASARDGRSAAQKLVDEAVAGLNAKTATELPTTSALGSGAVSGAATSDSNPAASTSAQSQREVAQESTNLPSQSETRPAESDSAEDGKEKTTQREEAAESPDKGLGEEEAEHSLASGEEQSEPQLEAAVADASNEDEARVDDENREPAPRKRPRRVKPARPPNFKARKIAAGISVAAAIAVITFQVYEWRARIGHALPPKSHVLSVVSNHSGGGRSNEAIPEAVSPSEKTKQPEAKSEGGSAASPIRTAKASPINPSAGAGPAKPHQGPEAKNPPNGNRRITAHEERAKVTPLDSPVMVPAKIVSQAQPPYPFWAKGLDIGTVVQLDAVIDSNGNLASTTPLSGPRILHRAAERAVALWVFEPATRDGKPVSSHMVLTVEFQR